MSTVRSAAIYARISSDQEGTGLGVDRQCKDCRERAVSLGWTVAEEYVDNDVSAYTGKPRPAYERMLADLADGLRDGVLCYHHDRLTRRPIELESFVAVLESAGGLPVEFVASGGLNLGTGDGLLLSRVLAAVAADESATKSRRVRRKMEEVAASGRPHGGANRPYGYEADKITVREAEAEVVRLIVARYVAGETTRSLAVWLNDEGIPTSSGKTWQTTTIRNLLKSGRIAGLREFRGQVVGPAVWDPIISEQDRARVLAEMALREASGRRAPRRYLLSGLLRCGKCSRPLYSSARIDRRRYVCMSGPDHGGCGGITVTALPVEELVTDAVLYRLDTPGLADALAGRAARDEVSAATAVELAADQAQLEELSGLYGAKEIGLREWMSARKPIEARIRSAERQLARASRSDALAGLVGNGATLGRQWADLNLERQHTIIKNVLDHAVIEPSGISGRRDFDPGRVRPVWRL